MDIFWSVKKVKEYEQLYGSGIVANAFFQRTYALIKNLSYNTQYLEFIDNALKLEIHSTIRTEFIKTFVTTGISIVESILYYFIKSEGLQKKEDFEEFTTITSNEKQVDESVLKVETKIFKKLPVAREVEMNLDSMLKKTEDKKLFGDDHSIYSQLKRLRKLRNKIHLYLIEEQLDHDMNNFKENEMIMMKKSLLKILFSERFALKSSEKERLLNFLK